MCFAPAIPMIQAAFASIGSAFGIGSGAAAAGSAAAGSAAAAGAAGASAWGTIGTAATIGSGVLGAYAALQNSKAAGAAAEASARQADEAAQQALEQGDRETQLHRRRVGLMQGENRAALAAQGVDLSSTAAIELLDDFNFQANEDAFVIQENAMRAAQGYGQQAANFRADGASARSAGKWGAAGSLLDTASRVGARWRPYVHQNRIQAQGGY